MKVSTGLFGLIPIKFRFYSFLVRSLKFESLIAVWIHMFGIDLAEQECKINKFSHLADPEECKVFLQRNIPTSQEPESKVCEYQKLQVGADVNAGNVINSTMQFIATQSWVDGFVNNHHLNDISDETFQVLRRALLTLKFPNDQISNIVTSICTILPQNFHCNVINFYNFVINTLQKFAQLNYNGDFVILRQCLNTKCQKNDSIKKLNMSIDTNSIYYIFHTGNFAKQTVKYFELLNDYVTNNSWSQLLVDIARQENKGMLGLWSTSPSNITILEFRQGNECVKRYDVYIEKFITCDNVLFKKIEPSLANYTVKNVVEDASMVIVFQSHIPLGFLSVQNVAFSSSINGLPILPSFKINNGTGGKINSMLQRYFGRRKLRIQYYIYSVRELKLIYRPERYKNVFVTVDRTDSLVNYQIKELKINNYLKFQSIQCVHCKSTTSNVIDKLPQMLVISLNRNLIDCVITKKLHLPLKALKLSNDFKIAVSLKENDEYSITRMIVKDKNGIWMLVYNQTVHKWIKIDNHTITQIENVKKLYWELNDNFLTKNHAVCNNVILFGCEKVIN